jgi:signal transduction histidine kinase
MAELKEQVTFSVDTHLFRELGELLVGRDATALLELVKNAYDADAQNVVVYADKLSEPNQGLLRIIDDGHGMSREEFLLGFLRIASRVKEAGDRRSALRKRRFTGAKGVGRLAAHKLARMLEVQSVPARELSKGKRQRIVASIDWDLIESVQTLDAIPLNAILLSEEPVPQGTESGTTITLRRLRRAWTLGDRARFVAEVSGFEPLRILTEPLPQNYLKGRSLIKRPRVRDAKGITNGDAFHLRVDGEFGDLGDINERELLTHIPWVLELRVDGPNGQKHLSLIPTNYADLAEQNHGSLEQDLPLAEEEADLTYDARILIRPGNLPKQLSSWQQRIHGVRVFMEGFRVLPYGEPGDDWLEFDRAVTERVRRPHDEEIARLARAIFAQAGEGAGLSLLPNKHYYGGVFLTTAGAPSLRMLVNREGFVPTPEFESIRRTLQTGVWLATYHMQASKRKQHGDSQRAPSTLTFESEARKLEGTIQELRALAKPASLTTLKGKLSFAAEQAASLRAMAQAIIEEAALLRDTAAVGLQLARFVHELNALLGTVIAIEQSLANLRTDGALPRGVRSSLRRVVDATGGLRKSFERYATYFGGLLSNTARRRRSVQPLRERLGETLAVVRPEIEERGQQLTVELGEELRTAPMFAAEVRTVFLNLLTNAIKAAGRGGRIRIAARKVRGEQQVQVDVENTGAIVDLTDAERWFEPFRTTTDSPDPVLGQGMGLGLPITRMIVHDYGGTIGFRQPSRGYQTSVSFTIPLKA